MVGSKWFPDNVGRGFVFVTTFVVAISATLLVVGMTPEKAYAADYVLDQTLCESFGGVWTTPPDTCTITTGIVLNSGDTLTIPSGLTLVVAVDGSSGEDTGIDNSGTIVNYGLLNVQNGGFSNGIFNTATGTITNSGTLTVVNIGDTGIENRIGSTITNSGTVNVQNSGRVGIEHLGGTITNSGTVNVQNSGSFGIHNLGGTITNSGAVNVQNSVQSLGVGILNEVDGGSLAIGTITNSGTLTVANSAGRGIWNGGGTITNSGTLNIENSDTIGILNSAGSFAPGDSSFTNSGTMTVANTGGTGIENRGPIDNTASGTMTVANTGGTGIFSRDTGTITNSGTLSIQSTGSGIENFIGGTITNSGTLSIQSTGSGISNAGGTLTNSGAVNVQNTGGTGIGNVIGGTASGTELAGTITNSGTVTVGNSGNSNGIYNFGGSIITNSGILDVQNSGGNGIYNNDGNIDNTASGTLTVANTGSTGILARSGSGIYGGTITNSGTVDVQNTGGTGIFNDGGTLEINDGGTLDLSPNSETLVHNNGNIYVNSGGTLNINSGAILDINAGFVTIFCGGIYFNNGTVNGTVTIESCDTDNDGIDNIVDTDPEAFSNDFSDAGIGGSTTGTITERGTQILTVQDEPNPDGVKVKSDASSPVTTPATVDSCDGALSMIITPGDEAIITCGSADIQIIAGPVEVELVGDNECVAQLSLDSGYGLLFDPSACTFTTPPENPGPVSVSIGGDTVSVDPGSNVQVDTTAAAKDSFIRSIAKDTNEGDNTVLMLSTIGKKRALVSFDLSEHIGEQVSSAKLRLYVSYVDSSWGSNGRTIDIHRLNSAWTEGNGKNYVWGVTDLDTPGSINRGSGTGVTWACANDTNISNFRSDCASKWNGGAYSAKTATATIRSNSLGQWIEFDVTGDVNSFLTGDMQNHGWLAKKTNENQFGRVGFASSENPDASRAPKLVLTFQ